MSNSENIEKFLKCRIECILAEAKPVTARNVAAEYLKIQGYVLGDDDIIRILKTGKEIAQLTKLSVDNENRIVKIETVSLSVISDLDFVVKFNL